MISASCASCVISSVFFSKELLWKNASAEGRNFEIENEAMMQRQIVLHDSWSQAFSTLTLLTRRGFTRIGQVSTQSIFGLLACDCSL